MFICGVLGTATNVTNSKTMWQTKRQTLRCISVLTLLNVPKVSILGFGQCCVMSMNLRLHKNEQEKTKNKSHGSVLRKSKKLQECSGSYV